MVQRTSRVDLAYTRPPPEIADKSGAGDDQYEVEKVLAHVFKHGVKHYLIKWKGWPYEESTFEPRSALDGALGALDKYNKQLKTFGERRGRARKQRRVREDT